MNEYTDAKGITYPIGVPARGPMVDDYDQSRVGLGSWRIGQFEWDNDQRALNWVYIAPSGWEYQTTHYVRYCPAPPPLPQEHPHKATCACGPHFCASCGQQYYIVLHGCADGFCTYCYANG